MLCCRPRKNKYDVDEAENESDKQKNKSKDGKEVKTKEKSGVANNEAQGTKMDAPDADRSDMTRTVAEVQDISNNANKQGDNNKDIVSGRTNNGVVQETVAKTEAGKSECAINAEKETNVNKYEIHPNQDKTKTEAYKDENISCSVENDIVKETVVAKQNPGTVKKPNEGDSKEANIHVNPLQEPDKDKSVAEQLARLQTESEEERTVNEESVMSAAEMQAAITRLEAVAVRLESLAQNTGAVGGKGGGGASDVMAPFVAAYDDLLKGEFAKYLELSNKIGGDVQTQANMVKAGFQAVKDFLVIVSKSKKPSQTDFLELLNPISQQITAIQDFRETKRGTKFFNHLSGISESIPALGWVSVEPTPGPYVKEMSDAGMFFTNRVIKEFKETEPMHVEWTKAWLGTLRELQAYIKEHHTTGVSWNPQGGDAKSARMAKPPAPPAAGGAPPPPPPGPPPPPPPPVADVGGDSEGGGAPDARAALFADLNKGEAVTTGLKKVTDDMKTHKNPALRAQGSGVRAGPAPFKAPSGPKPAPKPNKVNAPAAKPPVFELQLKKWVVEYQIGNKSMVIEECNLKQTVYMYKCENSTLQIKGKVNSITLDSCKKVAVVFDDVVSSIEFVNCQSIQAQVIGKCPTVSIDKTDGCLMYLSKDSLDAEIVTAKSSEMNILVPKGDGDFEEFPLPEQYKTTWNGKKFVTNVAESV